MLRSLLPFACVCGSVLFLSGCSEPNSFQRGDLNEQILSRQQDVLDATANGESYRAEDLLTDEDIRRVTGYTVLERNPGSVMGIYSNGCTWVLDTGRPGMNPEIVLGTKSNNGRSFFDSFLSIGGAAPVADLGDTAIRNSPVDITAVKGDVLVDIQYLEFPQPKSDIARQLAEAVFARLP